MEKKSRSRSALFNLQVLIGVAILSAEAFLPLFAGTSPGAPTRERPHQLAAKHRRPNPLPSRPSAGVQEAWVARYNGPANGYDGAHAIAVDVSGNVYVTGESEGLGIGIDYVTIKYGPLGQEEWVARYDAFGNSGDSASAIAIDNSGNVYVTGESYASVTTYDYATVKYNSIGQEQWVARYDGPAHYLDYANAIAVDNSGNVYVTGTSTGSGTGPDYATIKYNSAGQQQWVARYNDAAGASDSAIAIAVDNSGSIYVAGTSYLGLSSDYITIKYNSAGQEQWVARYNGLANGNDVANAMAVDSSGNVYVTGESEVSETDSDYVTVKYNAAGEEQWVARYDGHGEFGDLATAITVDNLDNVYVTGQSSVSGGNYDYATVKYDSAGEEQWVARYDGQGVFGDFATGVALDSSGNVYVTGQSWGSATGYDYATIKYDSLGEEQWAVRYNGPGNGVDADPAVAVDGSGNVYVTGASEGSGTGSDCATIKYVQVPEPTPTPTATATATATTSATPTTTPTASARPTPTPRPSVTPRSRPTPAPRPSP